MLGSRKWLVGLAVLGSLSYLQPLSAETNEFGQTTLGGRPDDNVAASAGRSPGMMVNAGVARGQSASQFAQGRIEITDATPTASTPRQVFLADAIGILFDQLNATLLYFENLLRERAGLDPRTPDDGTITGVVTDAGDGSPIRDATVTALDADDQEVGSATTDRNGEYTLTLPAGEYLLDISATDFATETVQSVRVTSGTETPNVDVELSASRSSR